MKSKLALYSYDCETRVEIALPDSESLTIMIEEIAPGGKYCGADIDPGAIPRNHRLSATGMDGIREDA